MNRRTKKKLKQEIRSLKNEVTQLTMRAWLNSTHYHQPKTYVVKAVVSMRDCPYHELAYPLLRNRILHQLEDGIDKFIETYRDDITGNHVACFQFAPTYIKETNDERH